MSPLQRPTRCRGKGVPSSAKALAAEEAPGVRSVPLLGDVAGDLLVGLGTLFAFQ